MSIEDQIIQIESGGNPNAQNPYSTAGGLGQFTNETWLNTIRTHRPDLARRYSPQELLALKTDPALSREMTGALASDNAAFLRQRGIEPSPGNVYLAHFAGAKGAAGILGADDSAPVSSVLSPDAISANPFLRNMTVADLKNWASRKMGAGSDLTSSPSTKNSPVQQAQPTSADLALSGAAGTGGAGQQAGQVNSSTFPGASLEQIPLLLAALRENDQPKAEAPEINFRFPTPPGIERTRALIRAMAKNPIV